MSCGNEPQFWYCGRCMSFIPMTYWHKCDDKETHSGPHERVSSR